MGVVSVETIEFGTGSVPVSTAAKIYGKDATWVRAGIIAGWLPIGVKRLLIFHKSTANSVE